MTASETTTPTPTIREVLGRHISGNFTGSLPVEWENMQASGQAASTEGWVHVAVALARFERVGFGDGVDLQRGRLRLTIAVARGRGAAVMDATVDELTRLLAGRVIGDIRMGAARITVPETEHGYHKTVMEIGFSAIGRPPPG